MVGSAMAEHSAKIERNRKAMHSEETKQQQSENEAQFDKTGTRVKGIRISEDNKTVFEFGTIKIVRILAILLHRLIYNILTHTTTDLHLRNIGRLALLLVEFGILFHLLVIFPILGERSVALERRFGHVVFVGRFIVLLVLVE